MIGLYAKLIAGGLVIAVAVGAWLYVGGLQSENVKLKSEVAVLGSKLNEQNQAVESWKAEADKRQRDGEAALKIAMEDTVKARAKASSFYKATPSSPDSCKAALDLMNGGAK